MELFSFIFGAVIGSFLNVLIIRLPKNKSLLTRSKCPNCGEKISWYFNIPIFSYFILKAKCKECKEQISFQYPFVEVLSATLTLFLFVKFNISLLFFTSIVFFYILIILSFIDLRYKAVPDYLLLFLFILSFFVSQNTFFENLKKACLLAGAFVILNFFVSFYIQNIKARILKDESLKTQEALGEGDIPVIAAFAVILGFKSILIVMLFAALFAIIPAIYNKYKNEEIQLPFIPFLSLAFIFEYFFEIAKVIF